MNKTQDWEADLFTDYNHSQEYQALISGLQLIWGKQAGSTEVEWLINWELVYKICIIVANYASQEPTVSRRQKQLELEQKQLPGQ